MARDDVADAGREASQALRTAAEAAPDEPGFFDRLLGQDGELVKGAWEATVGIAEFAYKLTPTYLLTNPEGFVDNLRGIGEGLLFAVQHPEEFALAVVYWETWKENPARALGHLFPDSTEQRWPPRRPPGARQARPVGHTASVWEGVRAQLSPDNPHSRPIRGSRPAADYQRDVAGDTEVRLNPDDAENRIWADGATVDADKVVAVEAKYVGHPGASPYDGTPPPAIQEMLMEDFDRELRRNAVALADPKTPVERLRIVTNAKDAAVYLQNAQQACSRQRPTCRSSSRRVIRELHHHLE